MKKWRVLSAAAIVTLTACNPSVSSGDLAVGKMTPETQADYLLFSNRCSKCHSVSRAFNQGDRDDTFWVHYVSRMRLQPGSGIAPEEEAPIVRFLHYYSEVLRKERGQ
jgi:hypothetical protein